MFVAWYFCVLDVSQLEELFPLIVCVFFQQCHATYAESNFVYEYICNLQQVVIIMLVECWGRSTFLETNFLGHDYLLEISHACVKARICYVLIQWLNRKKKKKKNYSKVPPALNNN